MVVRWMVATAMVVAVGAPLLLAGDARDEEALRALADEFARRF